MAKASGRPTGIQPLSRGKKINFLLYARNGIGKTTLVGTTPGRTLILRPPVDHTDSIDNPPPGMEEWVIRDWNENWEALDYLRMHGARDWDWVWMDSISLWQDIGLDDIWETVLNEKPQRRRYGLDKAEYGINMFRLAQWIRHIVGAQQFNFGVTAHPADLPEGGAYENDSRELLMPFVQGKNMSNKICGYMNVVGYLDLAKSKKEPPPRILRFNATDEYYAKDQFKAFAGGKLLNPTMPEIIKLIEEAKAKRKVGRAKTTRRRTASTRRKSTTPKGR
jgi:hypothetical protein